MERKQGSMRSRKFWVTIAGLLAVSAVAIVAIVTDRADSEIQGIVASFAGIVGAYVIGQGYADGQATKKEQNRTSAPPQE